MRSCPECGRRWSLKDLETRTETVHIDDGCFEEMKKQAAGNDRMLISLVQDSYKAWGLEHAGPRRTK